MSPKADCPASRPSIPELLIRLPDHRFRRRVYHPLQSWAPQSCRKWCPITLTRWYGLSLRQQRLCAIKCTRTNFTSIERQVSLPIPEKASDFSIASICIAEKSFPEIGSNVSSFERTVHQVNRWSHYAHCLCLPHNDSFQFQRIRFPVSNPGIQSQCSTMTRYFSLLHHNDEARVVFLPNHSDE